MDVTEPVVRTAGGLVRGRRGPAGRDAAGRDAAGPDAAGIAVFLGIPFAEPPTGDLRFAAPRPARPWDGTRDAKAFGPPPPQSVYAVTPAPPAAPGTDPDDWLTVNVFTPDPGAAGLPVMVWIYGGAYRAGSSSLPGYDGTRIAQENVVLVTFNHRIGVEGYAQLPGVPANRGLLDQVAALRWVRENIAAFGGDPDRVTVFGESAGAGAIAALLVMPDAAGLFRRAIAQSVPGTFFSPALASDITAAIAARAGLPATAEAFRTAGPARLTAAADGVRPGDHFGRWGPVAFTPTPFSPVVDGEVLPVAPWRAVAAGAARHVDLITGHTCDEYRLFMQVYGLRGKVTAELASEALAGLGPSTPTGGEASYRAAYPDADPETLFELVHTDWLFRMPTLHLAQAHAASGGRTFLYEFRYPASEAGLGACHAIDVPLVFGAYQALGQMLFGPEPPAAAVALGDLMREQWAAFAADGDPGWPLYSPGSRMTRIFDDPPDVASYPEKASMHLWDQHRFGVLDLEAETAR
ncbi:MAG TPA: carboxylesterase family protein [Streptosporangiaceae bacterium]|nr:carboxylesterase family protein [Streptosporangiaceae bacterium]